MVGSVHSYPVVGFAATVAVIVAPTATVTVFPLSSAVNDAVVAIGVGAVLQPASASNIKPLASNVRSFIIPVN